MSEARCSCKQVNAAHGRCMGQRLPCDIHCWQQKQLGGLSCYDKAYRAATQPQGRIDA